MSAIESNEAQVVTVDSVSQTELRRWREAAEERGDAKFVALCCKASLALYQRQTHGQDYDATAIEQCVEEIALRSPAGYVAMRDGRAVEICGAGLSIEAAQEAARARVRFRSVPATKRLLAAMALLGDSAEHLFWGEFNGVADLATRDERDAREVER